MVYTTAEYVQAELKSTSSFSSSTNPTLDTVEQWIKEESRHIDLDATRQYDLTSYTQTIDYNGSETITLKHTPIVTVSSLLYSTARLGTSDYALSATKTEDTDFTVDTEKGEIIILFNNWNPQEGRKRIQVTYTAGFTTIPLYVQKLATKMVAKRVLDSIMQQDLNEKKSGKSISVGSISIVKPSDFGVSSYKALSTDIAELKKDLVSGFGIHRYTNY